MAAHRRRRCPAPRDLTDGLRKGPAARPGPSASARPSRTGTIALVHEAMPLLRRGDPGRGDQVPLLRQHARGDASDDADPLRRGAPVHPFRPSVPARLRRGLLRDLGPARQSGSGVPLPEDRRRLATGLARVLVPGAREHRGRHRPQRRPSRDQDPAPPCGRPGRTTNGSAIASLVFGILGLFLGFLSILAIILGFNARKSLQRTPQPGAGLATAGLTLGWIGLVFWIIWVVLLTTGLVESPLA